MWMHNINKPKKSLRKHPNLDFFLKIFLVCLCYASTYVVHCLKYDPCSRRGAFLGFQNDTKGYVVLDLDTKEIFISRHVIFHEMTLSFLKPSISYHATTFSLPPNPLHLPPFFPNYHPFPKSNHITITPTTSLLQHM